MTKCDKKVAEVRIMCEICGGKNGQHDPRCPMADDPKVIAVCDCCGEEIFDFEKYYTLSNGDCLCRRCVENDTVSKRELLNALFEVEVM